MNAGQDVLSDFERASRTEWRLDDGLGGYAFGTVSGAPTRRAHALLAAPVPGEGPVVLVLRCEEKLAVGSAVHELSAAFAGGRARAGTFAQLESFSAAPEPIWRWRIDDVVIEKRLRFLAGHTALAATWRLVAGPAVRVSVAPLLTARAPHELLRETAEFRGAAQGVPGRVRLETLPGRPALTLWHDGAFMPARNWARALALPLEFATEDDGTAPDVNEDAFLPGWVQGTLGEPGATLDLVLSTEAALFRALASEGRLGTPPASTLRDCLRMLDRHTGERRRARRHQSLAGADLTARHAVAAHGGEPSALARSSGALIGEDDAIVAPATERLLDALEQRAGRLALAPRVPGGSERGSETLRAVAALVTLRAFEPARELVRGMISQLDEGLAPEAFASDGTPRHGDPEPSLWLIHAVDLLARRSSAPAAQDEFLREHVWPSLEGVLQHLRAGARGDVRCERDGLLWAGRGAAARARAGTNALWFHALVAMAQLGKLLGRRENAAFYLAWAHELQRRYAEAFWDETAGTLFDALSPAGPVRGVSPSQLWAIGMAPALLPAPLGARALGVIERELLAPDGVRAYADDSPADAAWLHAWAAAALRTHGRDAQTLARVRERCVRVARAEAPDPLVAAELLRTWVEECEHTARPAVAFAR